MPHVLEAPIVLVPTPCASTAAPKKLLTWRELQAYDPENEPWQKQFSRR